MPHHQTFWHIAKLSAGVVQVTPVFVVNDPHDLQDDAPSNRLLTACMAHAALGLTASLARHRPAERSSTEGFRSRERCELTLAGPCRYAAPRGQADDTGQAL